MAELSNIPTERAFDDWGCVAGELLTDEQIFAAMQGMMAKRVFDGFKKAMPNGQVRT